MKDLQKEAMEIYSRNPGMSMDEAMKKAKQERLLKGVPPLMREMFFGKNAGGF